jgi:hypothetical protein
MPSGGVDARVHSLAPRARAGGGQHATHAKHESARPPARRPLGRNFNKTVFRKIISSFYSMENSISWFLYSYST